MAEIRADMESFVQNFAVNKEVEVTTTRGTVKGKLRRIDTNNNLYLITEMGHAFLQFKYVISVQVLEMTKARTKKDGNE